jgi:5-methylthioadenosine/S-adenosylhomocysteine deaminase
MHDMLIRNGFVALMDRERTVFERGSVYIQNGRIAEVGEASRLPQRAHTVIDAGHHVVLPGFVNTHAHLQQYFRGVYELIGDFYEVNLPLEGYRSPQDMDSLGLASCAELIYGGCTTAQIIYTYPDGFAKAVEQAGNRVVLCADIEEVDLERLRDGVYTYLPEKGAAAFQRAADLFRNWHGKAGGRITTAMAPKAPDLTTADTYRKCRLFAAENGLRMTTHLSQSWREFKQLERLYDKTPPEHLHDLGVLNHRLTAAHCTFTTESDIRLIAAAGTGILHCRSVTNPLLRWLDMGIRIGLGTDDYHHDMLQLLRQNLTGQSTWARLAGGAAEMMAATRRTARPGFYELLEMATCRSAEALGMAAEIGSLEPGKRADILLVDMQNPYLTPTRDPFTSIVLYGSSADIDTVIVDGIVLKHDGALTTIDLAEALRMAQERVDGIIYRFFREHPDQEAIWEKRVRNGRKVQSIPANP